MFKKNVIPLIVDVVSNEEPKLRNCKAEVSISVSV